MPEKCTEACADLARLEQQIKDLAEQNGLDHKELRDRLNAVERSDAVQEVQYSTILDKLDDLTRRHDALNAKLEALEAKPGRKWDKIAETVLVAVVTGIVCFVLGRVGL